MALLERVTTLLRANINDLIDRAEDPEKLAKQLVLDMENQLLQLKTQVAIAIADQHLLAKKHKDHLATAADWHRKAELAVDKQQDDLARAALERSLASQQLAEGFQQQLEDQTTETENLRSAFQRLGQKLEETRHAAELLIARHRRARAIARATPSAPQPESTLNRLRTTITQAEAKNSANQSLLSEPTLEDRFQSIDREDKVEALLQSLKDSRHPNRLLQ